MDASWGTQIESHRDALHRRALQLCGGDWPAAEDMVQETYYKALRHARRFSPGTNLRAWLMRILHNSVVSAHRHRRVSRETSFPAGFEPASRPLHQPAALDLDDDLSGALRALPGAFRRVFLLAALEDCSYQEISRRLDLPLGTVMSRLWRARRFLQRKLAAGAVN